MPQYAQMSLAQLIDQGRQPHSYEAAQRELLRRAFVAGNGAAWDAVVPLLWPCLLQMAYATSADLTPARAEQIAYLALLRFQRLLTTSLSSAQPFPTYLTLIRWLQQCTGE